MSACNDSYKVICEREQVKGVGEVKVLRYEQLLEHALIKLGAEEVERLKQEALTNEEWDDREKSLRIVDSSDDPMPGTCAGDCPSIRTTVLSGH